MKKLIGLTIILVMTVPCAAKYSGGAGTAENPYKIADYNDLYTLADDANDYNKCFVMVADIDLNPTLPNRRQLTTALIAPYPMSAFTGTFDGNDCNILNLTIDTNGAGNDYLGLFGRTDTNAVISNLGVRDVSIAGSFSHWSSFLGGLVGKNHYGSVTNCYATGALSGSFEVGGLVGNNCFGSVTDCYATGAVSGNRRLGGLVGWNDNSSVTNCYATGVVTGDDYVGGLIGSNYDGSITNCYATGPATGSGYSVGGLVGTNGSFLERGGSITNCYATGEVSCDYYAGGLVGENSGSVTNCYAAGAVTGNDSVGGLVGWNWGDVTGSFWDVETSGTTVSDGGMGLTTSQMQQALYFQLYNWRVATWTIDEGNDYPHLAWEQAPGEFITDPVVTMAGSGTAEDPWVIESKDDFLLVCAGSFFWDKHYALNANIDLSGVTYIRGLIGHDSSNPFNSSNSNPFTGSFDGNGHVISNLKIEGESYLGLFGYIGPRGSVSDIGVEDVNITGGTWSRYLGGLVGYNFDGSISNCYATGTVSGEYCVGGLVGYNYYGSVTNCYATGAVTGDSDVGGLVGWNFDATVTDCSATGTVIGYGDYVGGLVGYNEGVTVTNCYVTGAVDGDSYVGGLVGGNEGSLTNCYATGVVTGYEDSYSVGGLVGRNQHGSVANCYATGAVSGIDYVGGLVGYDYNGEGFFVSSYFLDPNDGGGPDNGLGEPLTDTEMKQQASFIDWDFNDIWSICEGMNYPKLLWSIPQADMVCPDGVTFVDYSYLAERYLWSDYGDVNGLELSGNGKIENADFALFASWWGQTSCGDCGGADYTGDNAVDSADLEILLADWLATDYGDCEGAELTGDGFVGIDDALAFSEQWLAGF